jgi:hypothetical protein
MAVMGFTVDPGPLPFATVRDAAKWLPRLANWQIEIRSEAAFAMPQRMVRVYKIESTTFEEARRWGYYVPPEYKGRELILVYLAEL